MQGRIPRRFVVFADYVTPGVNETLANNDDFNLHLYTPTMARAYIADKCTFALDAYDTLVPIAFKSDLFRYCALWAEAGIYLDFDRAVVKDIHDEIDFINGNLLLIRDVMTAERCFKAGDTGTWQGLLIARRPRSPELLCAMQGVAKATTKKTIFDDRLSLTGPRRLADCLTRESDAAYIGYVESGVGTNIRMESGEVLVIQTDVNRTAAHWSSYGNNYYEEGPKS